MHQTRAQVNKKVPIARKGTKYVAKSLVNPQNSVPVVIAIRDMLKLARTAKEVREMIKEKAVKINGKEVKDYRDSIRLFNILEVGKSYTLALLTTGRFILEETKAKERVCKVIGKKILRGKKIQLNLHDGSNIISTQKINIHDSIYLDFSGKITKHISFEKGKDCILTFGRYVGVKAKIDAVDGNKVTIKLKDKSTILDKKGVTVI